MPGALVQTSSRLRVCTALQRVVPAASRFGRDERGLMSVFFCIMFAAMFLLAAIVVDVTRATAGKNP